MRRLGCYMTSPPSPWLRFMLGEKKRRAGAQLSGLRQRPPTRGGVLSVRSKARFKDSKILFFVDPRNPWCPPDSLARTQQYTTIYLPPPGFYGNEGGLHGALAPPLSNPKGVPSPLPGAMVEVMDPTTPRWPLDALWLAHTRWPREAQCWR